jgi:hypothetical protein
MGGNEMDSRQWFNNKSLQRWRFLAHLWVIKQNYFIDLEKKKICVKKAKYMSLLGFVPTCFKPIIMLIELDI